jgi:hypothetical protein
LAGIAAGCRKGRPMKFTVYLALGAMLSLLLSGLSLSAAGSVWNNACPNVLPTAGPSAALLKGEIPDWDSDHRMALTWPQAAVAAQGDVEPNELSLCRKVLGEIFKPGVIPEGYTDDKVLLTKAVLQEVGPTRRGENTGPVEAEQPVLFFRVRTEKYVLQFMKRAYVAQITVRLSDEKAFDIQQLASEIFTARILPPEWQAPCYSMLQRESRILRAGYWMTRDSVRKDESGRYTGIQTITAVASKAPLGKGLYGHSHFYTNGQFATIAIYAGPDPRYVAPEP